MSNEIKDSSSNPSGSTTSPSSSIRQPVTHTETIMTRAKTRAQTSSKGASSSQASLTSVTASSMKRRLPDGDDATTSRRQPVPHSPSSDQQNSRQQNNSSSQSAPTSSASMAKRHVRHPAASDAKDISGQSESNSSKEASKKAEDNKWNHLPEKIRFIANAQKAGEYQLIEVLGSGAYGVVFKGVHLSGTEKALKLVLDQSVARKEIATMQRINSGETNEFVGISEQYLNMDLDEHEITAFVMPLLKTDIFNLVYDENMLFPLRSILSIVGQLCSAVNYLADLGILHADIKPENVMLSSYVSKEENGKFFCTAPKAKLIDFNSVIFYNNQKIGRLCQPHLYRAPEVLLRNLVDERMELWSIGILALEILDFKLIFSQQSNPRQNPMLDVVALKKILEFLEEETFPERMIIECRKADMIEYLPNRGAYWPRIRHNDTPKYLSSYQKYSNDSEWEEFWSIINKMLKFDPDQRPTPAQALEALNDFL